MQHYFYYAIAMYYKPLAVRAITQLRPSLFLHS